MLWWIKETEECFVFLLLMWSCVCVFEQRWKPSCWVGISSSGKRYKSLHAAYGCEHRH